MLRQRCHQKKRPGRQSGPKEWEVDDSPGLHAHVSGAFRPGIVMKERAGPKSNTRRRTLRRRVLGPEIDMKLRTAASAISVSRKLRVQSRHRFYWFQADQVDLVAFHSLRQAALSSNRRRLA